MKMTKIDKSMQFNSHNFNVTNVKNISNILPLYID